MDESHCLWERFQIRIVTQILLMTVQRLRICLSDIYRPKAMRKPHYPRDLTAEVQTISPSNMLTLLSDVR
jgi:hypothetical protein